MGRQFIARIAGLHSYDVPCIAAWPIDKILASYAAWPFGREVVEKPTSGVFSLLGNVIWILVAGWWFLFGGGKGGGSTDNGGNNPVPTIQLPKSS